MDKGNAEKILLRLYALRDEHQKKVDELTKEITFIEGVQHAELDGWCIKDQSDSCDCPTCEAGQLTGGNQNG